ncbi:MAG TPA: DUF922 domain-containing protein [Chloroflexia bacterium]|nr:DUF922 domain-containing protein [Chloroflexia bacterium]
MPHAFLPRAPVRRIWPALALLGLITVCSLTPPPAAAPVRGALAALLPASGSNPTAQPVRPPSPAAPAVIRDTHQMACPAFGRYAHATGVTDARGQTHAGSVGMTTFDLSYQVTYQWVVRPASGVACVQTTQVDARFAADPRASVLDWLPLSATISPLCRLALERYTDQVQRHEQAHVRQITARIAEAEARWVAAAPESSCAATQKTAVQVLDRQLKTALSNELAVLKRQIDSDATAFHDTPDGRPIAFPDCKVCP